MSLPGAGLARGTNEEPPVSNQLHEEAFPATL